MKAAHGASLVGKGAVAFAMAAMGPAGATVVTSQRLAAVEVKSSSLLQRKYLLVYGSGAGARSRLASVQECGSTQTCLPAQTFEYENGSVQPGPVPGPQGWLATSDYVPEPVFSSSSNCGGGESQSAHVATADVDGDGRADLVVGFSGDVYLNNGRGWTVAPTWRLPVEVVVHRFAGTQLMDVNGDGLPDLVRSHDDRSTPTCGLSRLYQTTWLNTGSGWEETSDFTAPVIFSQTSNCSGVGSRDYGVTGADVNGDGLADLVVGGWDVTSRSVFLNTGRGWTEAPAWKVPVVTFDGTTYAVLMDVNSDGPTDLVQSYEYHGTPTCGVPVVYKATWLNALTKKPDLLMSVTNGLGGVERVEYASKASVAGAVLATPASESFLLTPTEGNLPSPGGWVVTRVVSSPDAGATRPYENRYSYSDDRRWWSSDWEERKGLGFRRTVTQQYNGGVAGKQAIAYARHSTGTPDEVKSAGLKDRDEVRDASGALWSRTSYTYEIGGATPVPGQKTAARPVVVETQTFDGLVP